MEQPTDFAIVGAGIAGASLAWELSRSHRVVLLERESQPGYHSTGRSAALYMPTYGTPGIQALTRASRAFFDAPPPGFAEHPLLTPRGVAYLGTPDQQPLLDTAWAALRVHSPSLVPLSHAELLQRLPCLRPEVVGQGLFEPNASDMDVHALHQGYLRGVRQQGGVLRTSAEVVALQRPTPQGGGWRITLGDGQVLQARWLVNAAGAWADTLARMAGAVPVGLVPRRRAAFTFAVPQAHQAAHWPAAIGIDESFYFKPDAGQMLGSPANADDTFAHDVQPEELDIALGIDRITQHAQFEIRRPTHTWAGLRSFVADGDFVIGWDARCEGFFWLAAQGGYGIQSAPGTALLARQLALGEPLHEALRAEGVRPEAFAPERLR